VAKKKVTVLTDKELEEIVIYMLDVCGADTEDSDLFLEQIIDEFDLKFFDQSADKQDRTLN
jgi:hypothetical protein